MHDIFIITDFSIRQIQEFKQFFLPVHNSVMEWTRPSVHPQQL